MKVTREIFYLFKYFITTFDLDYDYQERSESINVFHFWR